MTTRTPMLCMAVIGALVATACGSSTDPALVDANARTPTASTGPNGSIPVETTSPQPGDEPDPAETSSVELAPITTVYREPGNGTSPDQAATLAGSPIGWVQRDATWSFDMAGLVRVAPISEGTGECLILYGTATAVDTGTLSWTSVNETPDINLQVGDEVLRPTSSDRCDQTATLNSNHSDGRHPRLISGAAINVAYTFVLGDFLISDIDAVVIWSSDDEDLEPQYYLPSLIDSPPATAIPVVDYSGYESQPMAGAKVRLEDGETFDIEFQGVVTIPTSTAAEVLGNGTCTAIIGSATAVESRGGFVTDSVANFSLLAGGRVLDDGYSYCDTSELDAAGYQAAGFLTLAIGTSIDFFQATFVPDELADSAQLVVTDSALGRNPMYFELTPLDQIPPLLDLPDASIVPATAGDTSAGPFRLVDNDKNYSITIDGVVNAGPSNDGTATCFYILGEITVDQDGQHSPEIRLMTSGQLHGISTTDCGDSSVGDAGWERLNRIDFESGVAAPFHQLTLVPNNGADGPQVVIIGDATEDAPFTVLEPVYLDAVPSR